MVLDVLVKEITALLFSKKGSAILVSHPAFSYFCQDYDLTQLSIEIEGKDPLPQNVTSILKKAREYKVATIIIEPQYSDKGAQLIAECLKLPLMHCRSLCRRLFKKYETYSRDRSEIMKDDGVIKNRKSRFCLSGYPNLGRRVSLHS